MVSGGAYGSGTLVAWKESGGFAGTFSPNAAYVSTVLHLQPGTYFVALVYKTNRYSQEPTAIFMGAGSGFYSPTSLIGIELGEP
jgi:hypothetical protein